jgi:hypothetical protein
MEATPSALLKLVTNNNPNNYSNHDRFFFFVEGQAPVFISPRKRVAQLYPQALGSLLVASYDSQDYGVGIPSSVSTG